MKKFWRVKAPIRFPDSERRWSYSSLVQYYECPRRWWLLNCSYENVESGSRYPEKPSVRAVEGHLIHACLDAFSSDYVKQNLYENLPDEISAFVKFEPKKIMRHLLYGKVRSALIMNPRCLDVDQFMSQISLGTCLNKAKALVQTAGVVPSPLRNSRRATPPSFPEKTSESNIVKAGSEVSIIVDDPPLIAIADRIISGEISELKTGLKSRSHSEQLKFYALVYWLKHKKRPKKLKIYYACSNEAQSVCVPTEEQLQTESLKIRELISRIANSKVEGDFAAICSIDNCKYCSVRQLCTPYWASDNTSSLRTGHLDFQMGSTETVFRDIEILQLPNYWCRGSHIKGRGLVRELGQVHLKLSCKVYPDDSSSEDSLRVLGAMIKQESNELIISQSKMSEIYWCNLPLNPC